MTYVPCSREQEGLWLLEQTRDVGAANNLPVAVDLAAPIDAAALRGALRALVARHGPLRTVFAVRDGRVARIERDPPALPPIEPLEDLAEHCRVGFDLAAGPPFRVWLGEDRRRLLMTFHHCAFDGTSMDIALRDLAALYGTPRALAPLTAGYDRYVAGEREWMRALAAKARTHWEAVLPAVVESLRVPGGAAAGAERGAAVEVAIDAELRERLRAIGQARGASLFLALLAGLQVLQYRFAGGGEGGVATAVAMDARPRELRAAVGMFANEAPLHTLPSDELTFGRFLDQVRARARELFELRRFPFTEAVARFAPGDDPRQAAAQVGVTYIRARRLSPPGLEVARRRLLPSYGSRRPLQFWLFDEPGELRVRLDYDPRRVAPAVAAGMARSFVTLLRSIVVHPDAPLAEIELLRPAERRELASEWSRGPVVARSERTVPDLFEEQVVRTPDAPAVELDGKRMTYGQLNARANRLAHRLRGFGVGRDVLVAICAERSFDLVVGLLAILKAGGAYVPLDPGYPLERLALMLEDTGAPVLLTQERLRKRLPRPRGGLRERRMGGGGPAVVLLDDELDEPATNPARTGGRSNLAYVIYTSGSTGRPKGVAMAHGPLVNLLGWQRSRPARTLQFASASFDVAFQDIFSTLATGGCLVLVSEDERRDFDALAALIRDAGVERIFVPFLALNELARRLDPACGPLEVIAAGERLEITPAIRRLFGAARGWTLENQYGPTESHVVTAYRLEGDPADWPELPPIGRPIANARTHVLDRRLKPVPVGVPGELYLGGACLARGYLKRPELTAERFVRDPFGPPGARLYRTGDLARWRADGQIEFLGRADDQVKIRGFRVEPGEIEARLVAHPAVREAAVLARDGALVAYVVGTPGARELRAWVRDALPDHMVPSGYARMDALPLTPNGKLDRRALPAPEPVEEDGYVAPRDEVEARLAAIWAGVLRVDRVGVEDDFFELGGHSLLAAEVAARAREAFGRDVPVRLLFVGPTVAQMARGLASAERAPIGRAERPLLRAR